MPQHEVNSFKLLQNEYNFTMKNIYKNLLSGQLNILIGSHRNLLCRKPVGSILTQDVILPSNKEGKADVNRDERKRAGGNE